MMTDEEEQEVTHFKKKLNHLKIEFELISQEKAIFISILNLERLQCYEQKINSSYIQERQGLFFIFETPRDLMKYMVHHFKDLIIKDDGSIEFSIKFSEIMRPRLVVISLREKQMDKIEMMNLKMEIMKEEFNEQLEKKKIAIEGLKEENQVLKESIKNLNNSLFYNHAHPQGYHNQYFVTKFTGKSIIVNHIGQNTNYIFVFNHEITVGSIKRYNLKVLKSASIGNAYFGFGSRLILNNSANNCAEVSLYRCDGYLFEGGPSRSVGVASAIGDQLQCQLNLAENTITWTKSNNLFATTTLPQQMRNKPLYFALNFHAKFDEIEVMLT